MSEPGAVSGAVQQGNTQGVYSSNHFNSFIPSGGDPTPTIGTGNSNVGFTSNTPIESEVVQQNGDHDEVRGLDLTNAIGPVGESSQDDVSIFESPFVTYVKKVSSNGKTLPEQKYYKDRNIGRQSNFEFIRNGVYYGEQEADIFNFGLSTEMKNREREEIMSRFTPIYRDV